MGCYISKSSTVSPCPSDSSIREKIASPEKILPVETEESIRNNNRISQSEHASKRISQLENSKSTNAEIIRQLESNKSPSPKVTEESSEVKGDTLVSPEMATESAVQPEIVGQLPELQRTKEGHLIPQDIPKSDLGDEFVSIHEMYNSLNDGQRAPYLHDPSYMLILDARERSDYSASHITTARHSTAVDSEYDCLLSQGKLDKFTMVIAYDQCSTFKMVGPALAGFVKKLKVAGVDVLILSGGYDAFYKAYPFLCNGLTIRSEQDRMLHFKSYPSLVIEDTLYQGNVKHSMDETILKNLKITHVLNVSRECKNSFPKTFKYLQVKVEDESTEQLGPHLQKAARFVAEAIATGGRAFVHCVQGKSRSSTCTIAFLMSHRGWILKDAHDYLKERRSIAAPNRGFLIQLSKFEESIFGKVISSVDDLYF